MRRAIFLLMTLAALSGCGNEALAPSEAKPLAARAGDTRPRVAFCYNQATTSPRNLVSLARKSCGTGFTPRFIADGSNLGTCPLLSPSRVTFACERDSGY